VKRGDVVEAEEHVYVASSCGCAAALEVGTLGLFRFGAIRV
jgi:hypothetical protein